MINLISMLKLSPGGGKVKLKMADNEETRVEIVSANTSPPSSPVIAPQRRASFPRRRLSVRRRPSIAERHRSNSWAVIMSQSMGSAVPAALVRGVPMQKISSKKVKQVIMRLEDGCITWAGSSNSKVPINQIRELRLGQPASSTGLTSSRWITIVYVRSKEWKILHMISLTDDIHQQWVDTLRQLVSETSDRAVAEVKPSDPDLIWIRQLWPAGSHVIDMSTAVGLCRSIGLEVPRSLHEKHQDSLDLSEFRQLVKDAQSRPELEALFLRLTSTGPLDRARVQRFLTETQRIEPADIFDSFAHDGLWTFDSLTEFLSSEKNVHQRVQDMTHPLPDYFISSSHNTYLVGEQWRGESTVEGYIRVLLAGCRCVELDCHNGEFESEVFHKLTLTSRVSVRDICKAIDKYAFLASPYPVIISAEIHCNLDQQNRMAATMKEIFGDKLVAQPIDDRDVLPSPEDLKYRILFKTKPKVSTAPSTPAAVPPTPGKDQLGFDERSSTSDTESDSALTKLVRRISFGTSTSSSSDSASPASSPRLSKKAFSDELKELLVYTAGVKYNGFSKLNNYKPHHQFSVSDRTAERILRENRSDWIKHNFSHLTRIYPKGARLLSSNYDPRPVWTAGNQLVALNWQTVDQGTILNHALFADTQGYVLKPLALRQKTVEPRIRCRIRIEVISGQRLPLASDMYVEGQIDDEEQKTKSVKGQSVAPSWNHTFEWTITTVSSMLDLTFVKLEVRGVCVAGGSASGVPTGKGAVGMKGMIGQWTRPVSAVPRGYRYLPLYDGLFSKYVFATLFVRVDVDVTEL